MNNAFFLSFYSPTRYDHDSWSNIREKIIFCNKFCIRFSIHSTGLPTIVENVTTNRETTVVKMFVVGGFMGSQPQKTQPLQKFCFHNRFCKASFAGNFR